MSAVMEDVARASLPVAIALLGFAAAARAVLWVQLDHEQAQRIARQYGEPLSTWCLVAAGTHLFALTAAGNPGLLSLLLPVALGVGAALLRGEDATTTQTRPAAVEPTEQTPTVPVAPTGRLWADEGDEQPTRPGGLWGR